MLVTDHTEGASELTTIAEMVDDGKLQPVLDTTFEMTSEGIEAAYARLKSRRTVGKIVVVLPAA